MGLVSLHAQAAIKESLYVRSRAPCNLLSLSLSPSGIPARKETIDTRERERERWTASMEEILTFPVPLHSGSSLLHTSSYNLIGWI